MSQTTTKIQTKNILAVKVQPKLIGLCHICHSSGVEITLTKISKNDIGETVLPMCVKCKK